MDEEVKKPYQPNDDDREAVEFVYDEYDDMWQNTMNRSYPEFNDRTLKSFLDDSQKRLNSYIPTRESQGKEDWQANVFTGSTRNKVRSYVSSVSKEPPEISVTATNAQNERSAIRAEVMQHLLRHSYIAYDNPEKTIFYDGWDCAGNGTVIKYDGYAYAIGKEKILKEWNPITGEVEVEEKDVIIEDRPIEIGISPNRFFVKNAHVHDVQDQPAVLWIEYLNQDDFDREFGKFPNAKYVKTYSQMGQRSRGEMDLFFGEKWFDRMESKPDKIEVLRYYRKGGGSMHRVVAHGVLLLDAPLLWGRNKKWYPFAKAVFEPFANSSLFWGNSMPNILMPNQDIENALYNSSLDKAYRTLVTPMLVGMINKDSLELEDEFVTGDTRIYVDNVDQVRPMPVPQVSASEFNMLKMVSSELSLASVDALQQGFSGSGSTAREIVIANEKANEIKGIFFIMLKDLWLQKTRVRKVNILLNYNRPRELGLQMSEEMSGEYLRIYNVPRTKLSSGETGTLQIRLAPPEKITALNKPVGFIAPGKPFNSLDVEEERARLEEGQPVEIIVVPPDILDDFEYEFEIQTQSLYQRGRSFNMAMVTEKVTTVAKLFPELFQANKDKFFADYMKEFGENPGKYLEGLKAQAQSAMPGPGLPSPAAAPGMAPAPMPELAGSV